MNELEEINAQQRMLEARASQIRKSKRRAWKIADRLFMCHEVGGAFGRIHFVTGGSGDRNIYGSYFAELKPAQWRRIADLVESIDNGFLPDSDEGAERAAF